MMVKKIGIIGLGNVGSAVLESFSKYSSLIAQRTALKIKIVKVCDLKKNKERQARKFSLPFTANPQDLIGDPRIDIVVELIGGIEPARSLVIAALKQGKNIVTANKALLASKGKEIFSLAKARKRHIGFEACVCSAIPIIKSVSEGLLSCDVKKIYGILNGTTNHILYQMEKRKIDFSVALSGAQRKGLAEKKADLDIEGIDTLHKLCILSYLCYGIWPSLNKVYAEGISRISLLDILYARDLNYKIKLLAIAKKEKGFLDLRVHPTLVPTEHPLSQVPAAYNAVSFDTQPAGKLLFYGEGAGGLPTSSAVISDIVNIAAGRGPFLRREGKIKLKNIKDIKSRFYIRFMAQDKPGVLARISKILASLNISISSVTQKERKVGKFVPIIMLTHEAIEDSIRKALAQIDKLKCIKHPSQIMRIEDI